MTQTPEEAYIAGVVVMAGELKAAADTLAESRKVNRDACRMFIGQGKLSDEQLSWVKSAYPAMFKPRGSTPAE
jgi:hypothetical protein